MDDLNLNKEDNKFCQHCGAEINEKAVVCVKCGCQVDYMGDDRYSEEEFNSYSFNSENYRGKREKNKWIAFLLCFFLGIFGIHKFYEDKIGMGILYILTGGLFGIGWFVDCIILLCKPDPYYI